MECVARSLGVKGRIVEADPRETGEERALLNLGHTFGHALESALGLGLEKITHGEAVAWGTVRAAELGRVLGITPPERERKIRELFRGFGYEIRAPHPLLEDRSAFIRALGADKKKREGKARFIVPSEKGAVPAAVPGGREAIIEGIVRGDYW
jgi:3-dehydroquinate synthase